MDKPIIGIVPLMDYDKDSYWMLPGYMKGIGQAGGLPLMLPLTDDADDILQIAGLADGFLFTGGHDVSPAVYGAAAAAECGELCPERDRMETLLFSVAYTQDKPVLGICRGIQFINAVMGGTLYQDLPSEHPSDTEHHQTPPYDVPVHTVKIMKDSPLFGLLNAEIIGVNSYHHQAVKDIAPGLVQMACSPDGLTEAVYAPDKNFIWAVQWHPEFSYLKDENSRKIFRRFVSAAGRR